jgi:hypothetical protein
MQCKTLALAGAMVLFAGAALADDPMANTYANTITTKDTATGQTAVLLFNADMTYRGSTTDPSGKPVQYTGGWSLKDDGKTICLTTNLPPNTPNAPKPSCSPLVPHNVGDSWTVSTDQGQTFQITMTAGR